MVFLMSGANEQQPDHANTKPQNRGQLIHSLVMVAFVPDQHVPEEALNVPTQYLRQMEICRIALETIYPDPTIELSILWVETPRLMALDNKYPDQWIP